MNKESLKKFNDSLAASMALPMSYAPVFCLFPMIRGAGAYVFVACVLLFVFFYFEAWLLYLLIGDINRHLVNEDRRLRGYFSILALSMILMVGYMLLFEDAVLWLQVLAWTGMVVLLFFATYSVCKSYILKP